MKILAVDDQPLILKSILKKLTNAGYKLELATGGQEAIDSYEKERPDLIILDLEMPETDGFAVIEHIRNVKEDNVPIIVMSGNDEENTVVDTFKLGVNDYIQKPVGLNELLVRVQRQLQQTFKVMILKVMLNLR